MMRTKIANAHKHIQRKANWGELTIWKYAAHVAGVHLGKGKSKGEQVFLVDTA